MILRVAGCGKITGFFAICGNKQLILHKLNYDVISVPWKE